MPGNTSFPDDLDLGQTIRIPRFGIGQTLFKRYTLERILGRGGMGVVWLARDEQLESLVALKVLPETLCHDRASLESLKRETKLGLQLAHPNIVRIFDFQRDDYAAAISMEYVDGATLSDVRTTKPQQVFNPADLEIYFESLCDALTYAHMRRKIVHRDLKPRNLMLDSEGELKIADFGISRSISESMIMVTGMLGSTGSPPYISPQQWDGEQPTPLDDIYSVGATLYELLSSKPPLLGVVDRQQVHSRVPPPIWKRRIELGITEVPDISPEWEETIAACLAKDSKDRPQTIRDLQTRLTSIGASAFSLPELKNENPITLESEPAETPDDVGGSRLSEENPQEFSDDPGVVTRASGGPKLEAADTPAIDPNLAPAAEMVNQQCDDKAAANVFSTQVSHAPEGRPDVEPIPSPPADANTPTPVPESAGSAALADTARVSSQANPEISATAFVDIRPTERTPLSSASDDPPAAQALATEREEVHLPPSNAEPSDISLPVPAAISLAPPPAAIISFAPVTPDEPIAAISNEAAFSTPDIERPLSRVASTSSPRQRWRWVWVAGTAATLLLSGILLIKKPVGGGAPARRAQPEGAVQRQIGANVARTALLLKPTDNRSLGRPTPPHTVGRKDLAPPALSLAASAPPLSAPPVADASVAAANSAKNAASPASSSATETQRTGIAASPGDVPSPSGTPVVASTAAGLPPVQDLASAPSPRPALEASKDIPLVPNSTPAVVGAQNIPPAAHQELASSPDADAPASTNRPATRTNAELGSRKSEKRAKRTRRESTPAPRRVDSAAPVRASPTPSTVPVRKRAPQPFEDGVPGG